MDSQVKPTSLEAPEQEGASATAGEHPTGRRSASGRPTGESLLRGVTATLAGGVLWGFSGSCIQFLQEGYAFPALMLTATRMLGAGLLFLALLAARNRNTLGKILRDRTSVARLVVFGCVGLLLCQLTYIISISYTNAGTATVLASFGIVFCMVATCLITRRLPRAAELGGLVCAVVATFLIATGGNPSELEIPFLGLVFGLLNAATLAFYTMYPRRLFAQWGSLATTGLGMLAGGIAASVIWCAWTVGCVGAGAEASLPSQLDVAGWATLALVIVAGTFGAFGLYLHGVSVVGGVRGTQLGAIEPVSATVFATLWLGASFTWADWAGLVLMVATVLLVARQ